MDHLGRSMDQLEAQGQVQVLVRSISIIHSVFVRSLEIKNTTEPRGECSHKQSCLISEVLVKCDIFHEQCR